MTEVYDPKVIRPLFRQLVKDFGSYDAAGAVLGINKGNITKMIAGDLPIHTHHWGALEDATGRYPITDAFWGRKAVRDGQSDVVRLAELVLDEHGDIPSAILQLVTRGDASRIAKEGPELVSALTRLIEAARREEDQSQLWAGKGRGDA